MFLSNFTSEKVFPTSILQYQIRDPLYKFLFLFINWLLISIFFKFVTSRNRNPGPKLNRSINSKLSLTHGIGVVGVVDWDFPHEKRHKIESNDNVQVMGAHSWTTCHARVTFRPTLRGDRGHDLSLIAAVESSLPRYRRQTGRTPA